jgi:hypothetical protein
MIHVLTDDTNQYYHHRITNDDIEIQCAHGLGDHLLIGMNNGELALLIGCHQSIQARLTAHDGITVACALNSELAASVGTDKVQYSVLIILVPIYTAITNSSSGQIRYCNDEC